MLNGERTNARYEGAGTAIAELVGARQIMKGVKTMEVGEVVKMITCSQIRIRGSYSGKIYYQSWTNSKERLKQFENERCYGIKAELHVPIREYDPDCVYPVICIWMDDYDKCSKGAKA